MSLSSLIKKPVEAQPNASGIPRAIAVRPEVTDTSVTVVESPTVMQELSSSLHQALQSLTNQLTLAGKTEGVTLKQLEVAKQQSSSVFDALNKALHLSHLEEIILNNAHKFKRAHELEVLNPLLESLKRSAEMANKSLGFLLEQLGAELEKGDGADLGRIACLQLAYDTALDNVSKTVNALAKTIKLERDSGGRNLGKRDGALSIGYIEGLEEPVASVPVATNGQSNGSVRKLTPQDLKGIIGGRLAEDPEIGDGRYTDLGQEIMGQEELLADRRE